MQQSDTNMPYKSFYKYPVSESVQQSYNEELTFNRTMGDYRAHAAVDFKANKGAKVTAINDGLCCPLRRTPCWARSSPLTTGATWWPNTVVWMRECVCRELCDFGSGFGHPGHRTF